MKRCTYCGQLTACPYRGGLCGRCEADRVRIQANIGDRIAALLMIARAPAGFLPGDAS